MSPGDPVPNVTKRPRSPCAGNIPGTLQPQRGGQPSAQGNPAKREPPWVPSHHRWRSEGPRDGSSLHRPPPRNTSTSRRHGNATHMLLPPSPNPPGRSSASFCVHLRLKIPTIHPHPSRPPIQILRAVHPRSSPSSADKLVIPSILFILVPIPSLDRLHLRPSRSSAVAPLHRNNR